jgi:uncharacterized protein YerC
MRGRLNRRLKLVLDRERILRMNDEGYTARQIGVEMGVSAATVCRILQGYRRKVSPEIT